VQRFRNHAVGVRGSTNVRVEDIIASTNCGSGIFVAGNSFGAFIHGNVSVRNGAITPGNPCGGIWVAGHNSRVRLNDTDGNGYMDPADDFGIGAVGTASGNVIEENRVTGNTTGIFIAAGVRDAVVRDNFVLGTPAVQIANTRPDLPAADIRNLAAPREITFERNLCITAVNAPCETVRRSPR
jgi:nitrous oxidase accessory protein NosD